MNRGKAAFDRLITFLLFLVFAALAAWGVGLYLDTSWAHRISGFADRDFWAGLSSRDNYANILQISALVAVLVGLLLLAVNIERKRLGRTTSPSSGTEGMVRVHPADIGSAVAQTFERREDVRSATYRAVQDRSTDIIEIRLRVTAEVDIVSLRDECSRAAAQIDAALPGQDVRPRFLLQSEQVQRD